MPHYALLLKFTDKGIANVKDSPNRADAFAPRPRKPE